MDTLGQNALNAGKSYVNTRIHTLSPSILRPYFKVTPNHVLSRIILLLFPFKTSRWTLFSPDLYVPFVSYQSFLLVKALCIKNNKLFAYYFTKTLVIEVLLIVFVKALSFFMDVEIMVINLVAVSFHKYIVMVAGLLCGSFNLFVGRLAWMYLVVAMFVFFCRGFKYVIGSCGVRRKSVYFLMFVVVLECFYVLLLK
ncbi:putative membrane protein [Trachipleistophora hominis]|uniref:Protein YIF1 n=1 Tax=Trachipleistophora hominis TaxID=72359 RepID=L7JXK7_TRAHO|nr:putative membrane protein [Trachipleistophora hominis]